MKQVSIILSAMLIALASCKNKAKETVIISDDGKEKVSINTDALKNAGEEMEKMKERLSGLTPATLQEIKELLPETLAGVSRSNVKAVSAMGTTTASADYRISDDSKISIGIYDCAGTAGAGIYSLQYMGMFNIETDDDDEYTKTIDFNGGKAFERCRKDRVDCTLTYFGGGRFLISLEGDNVGIDALKAAAGEIKFK